jgi:hypothetical protein
VPQSEQSSASEEASITWSRIDGIEQLACVPQDRSEWRSLAEHWSGRSRHGLLAACVWLCQLLLQLPVHPRCQLRVQATLRVAPRPLVRRATRCLQGQLERAHPAGRAPTAGSEWPQAPSRRRCVRCGRLHRRCRRRHLEEAQRRRPGAWRCATRKRGASVAQGGGQKQMKGIGERDGGGTAGATRRTSRSQRTSLRPRDRPQGAVRRAVPRTQVGATAAGEKAAVEHELGAGAKVEAAAGHRRPASRRRARQPSRTTGCPDELSKPRAYPTWLAVGQTLSFRQRPAS